MTTLYYEAIDRELNVGSILVSTDNTKMLILDRNGVNKIVFDTKGNVAQNVSGAVYSKFLKSVVNAMLTTNQTKLVYNKENHVQILRQLGGAGADFSANTKIAFRESKKNLIYLTTKYGLLGIKEFKFKRVAKQGIGKDVYRLEVEGLRKHLTVTVLNNTGDKFIAELESNVKHILTHGANGIKQIDFDNLFRISGGDMNRIYYSLPNYS